MKQFGFGGTALSQCLGQATREGDAKISTNGNVTEIRLCPRVYSEPFQSGTPSLFTYQFQAKP